MLALLDNNIDEFSKNLALVTKNHKKSGWLHDFNNNIGKFLPFISYGLLSLAHHSIHLKQDELPKASKEKIWWQEFIDFNTHNNYKQSGVLINFTKALCFLNN